jgi:hypothetical protein
MRILIPLISILTLSLGCSKDKTDADPCARAVSNAERLVKQDAAARRQFGDQPLSIERCRTASASEVSCIAYASDWQELARCSPNTLEVGTR